MDAELTKTFVYDPGGPDVVQESLIKAKDVAKHEEVAKRENNAKDEHIAKDEDERHVIYSVGVSRTCFSK